MENNKKEYLCHLYETIAEELSISDTMLEKAIEVLTHEGSGHTFAIHAEDKEVVRKFAT